MQVSYVPVSSFPGILYIRYNERPLKTTTYNLDIKDSVGCPYQKNITIVVLPNYCGEPDIFVPNTFTPNQDGKNDLFYIRGNNIKELYFAIYNRWGERVFFTTSMENGWDGTFNGKAVSPDVYGYYVKGICKKIGDSSTFASQCSCGIELVKSCVVICICADGA